MAQDKAWNGKIQSLGLRLSSAVEQNSYSIEMKPYTSSKNLLRDNKFYKNPVINF